MGRRGSDPINQDETRKIFDNFERLHKNAKEGRYEGGEYAPLDLAAIEARYNTVRSAMRKALNLDD